MRVLQMKPKENRLITRPARQPSQCSLSRSLGDAFKIGLSVDLRSHQLVIIGLETTIESAASAQDDIAHESSRFVTRLLEALGQCLSTRQTSLSVECPDGMLSCIARGHNGSVRGCCQTRCGDRLLKQNAARGQGIDPGGRLGPKTIGMDPISTQRIDCNQKNVGSRLSTLSPAGRKPKRDQ